MILLKMIKQSWKIISQNKPKNFAKVAKYLVYAPEPLCALSLFREFSVNYYPCTNNHYLCSDTHNLCCYNQHLCSDD